MSTIERLSIQGIRSFGGNAGDAQVIRFSSPVTLILGENGCGKTTVIECLKYALTGEVPPGSDRGKNFVHDPKIFGLTDVLGQIKLEVRNVQGARLSICRSMKLGMKRNKISFETLDATLNYLNDDDKKSGESISKRCADVDLVMSQFMGVSKAIINNVLFCHQEDSSWPLDEAKKLKEKFDAIFGITEYNRALDRIIKMRKDEMEQLKVKEADLRFVEHLKQEMEGKSLSLQKYQQKASNIDDQCKQCEEEMAPIEERLKQIYKIEYEVAKYQSQKVELQTKQKNCADQMTGLKKKIKKMFEGSMEELENEITSFSQRIIEKRMERKEVEEKIKGHRVDEKKLQSQYNDIDKKRVITQQEMQKELDCKVKRADKLKVLCHELNIPIEFDIMNSVEGITQLLDDIQGVLTAEQVKISETVDQHDKEDQDRQNKMDQLRVELTKLQESVLTLQKQKKTGEKESEQLEKNILQSEKATHQLKMVTEKLKETEQCYEQSIAKFNQNEFRESLKNDKETIKMQEEKFRKVDERLTFLNSISKLVAELNIKEKELEKREEEMRRIKSKHNENFRKVFEEGRNIEGNYQRLLKASYEKSRIKIKDYNEKLNSLKMKQQRVEIKRKNLKEDLQKCEKELEDSKEKMFEKCHSTSYEEMLTKSKVAVSKYQLEHGAQKSAELFYKKYLQKIDEEPYCPLCQKCMDTVEAANLTSELTDKIQDLPQNIERIEKLLKEEQKKYESLLHLKPVIDKVTRLETEIPTKKEEMKMFESQLIECSKEVEETQNLLAEPTATMDAANLMMGDMSILDESIKESTRLKTEIEKVKKKMPENNESDNVSIEEVQAEKSAISTQLDEKRKEVEKNQQSYEKNMDALNKLREMKNSLKDQQIKLQEGIQNLPQLKERKIELSKHLVTTVTELQEKQSKVLPLKQQLNIAATEKAKLKEANRAKIIQMQKKLDNYRRMDHDINGLDNEVLDYQKLNLEEQLRSIEESLNSSKEDLKKMAQIISEAMDKLDNIKSEIANQESIDRDFKDNRELKTLEEKEKDLNEKLKALCDEIGKLDFPNVSKEKSELTKKRDKITVRKGELLGQRGETKHQILKLEKELAEPKYRDALVNYRRIFYEVQLTKKIANDLGQHRVALEWALMQFHTEKMQEINRLIREYWRLIYRGNDIDYIQIQTEEGKETASSPMDRRRSYNYRVIQSKNNSEIEMRGRCSAGQRVLASLIIRMALAETFSSNCGVLALDEPTTNLDRMNILSLCDALNRIVEDRQAQSNFMLIIITHDEAFISTLGKINSYHRVFRNDECKSVIRRVEVA